MSNQEFYRELATEINRTLGRKAVSSREIGNLVEQAKMIRRTRGLMGLMAFASEIPYRYFTPEEIEYLRHSPRWNELGDRLIRLLVMEGVITPAEAGMLRRYL
ncbi:hypothetical protein [Staphylospora marina]|uniref:hypothetical protein n=1 Tax=Staphylospora marina TaxID=2490858 RepID=UPI000F5BB9E2|nr:hypothetical protein [Staphylospora marina]